MSAYPFPERERIPHRIPGEECLPHGIPAGRDGVAFEVHRVEGAVAFQAVDHLVQEAANRCAARR